MQTHDTNTKISNLLSIKNQNITGIIENYIPLDPILHYKEQSEKKLRNRVFTLEVTLTGMLYQASQDDKSQQSAVLMLNSYHNERMKRIVAFNEELIKEDLKKSKENPRKRGRPRRVTPKVPKSFLKSISLNTASYDEATTRMPLEVMKSTFNSTTEWFKPKKNEGYLWKGKPIYSTDGTTFKTNDTKELREYFDVDLKKNNHSLPIGKFQGLVRLGAGIVGVKIDQYNSSEPRMMKSLYPLIEKGSILLGDDLYSSYGQINYCQHIGIDIITQGKHKRNDKIIKKVTEKDLIVEWESSQKPKWYDPGTPFPKSIRLRKLIYDNPKNPNNETVLYTTLLDEKKYPAIDILALYLSRWEIEVNFFQIKQIMKMEYLRGKTPDMVFKEIYAHLILYNIMRKIISQAGFGNTEAFSPLSGSFQTGTSVAKGPYIDKLGRSYKKWSAGRRNLSNTPKI